MSSRKDQSPDREFTSELTTVERFYNYPKEGPNYAIGEKRVPKPDDGPGPGQYNLDNSATKTRTTGSHRF